MTSGHDALGGAGDSGRDNRRRFFRLSTVLDVRVWVDETVAGTDTWRTGEDGRRFLDTITEDMSVGGLRLRAPRALARGTPVDVAFTVGDTPVELSGTVAHAARDGFGAALGVEFANVERSPASAPIARFLFAQERRRLPRVLVMYSVRCHATVGDEEWRGATEECSPAFVRLLIEKAIEPGRRVTVALAFERATIRLLGRIASCEQATHMWRTAVELEEPVPARWREMIAERRTGLR